MEELWLEDGRLNPKALFGEVDDCSACPFYRDNVKLFDTDYVCHNNPDAFLPCQYMEDYGAMTLLEVAEEMDAKLRRAEAYWDRQYQVEKQRKEKASMKAKKAEQTRNANYSLNKEITRLRKLIRDRESAIQSLNALHSAFGFANAMMEGRNIDTVPVENEQVRIWKQANIRDKQVLEELLNERDRRNRERRNSSKR